MGALTDEYEADSGESGGLLKSDSSVRWGETRRLRACSRDGGGGQTPHSSTSNLKRTQFST